MATVLKNKIEKSYLTDQERWEAVIHRDKDAADAFFYSVETTGVYCRPSCPARLARRENVVFHPTPKDAERAGFRACKRCKPNDPSAHGEQAAIVARACKLIVDAEEPLSLDALAEAIGPCGTTCTYSELAQKLGQPNATRAVAGACAANKLAVAIPCHRVVRTNGLLSGYRWGVERKEKLLHVEGARI